MPLLHWHHNMDLLYETKPKDLIMLYFLIGKNRIKVLDWKFI